MNILIKVTYDGTNYHGYQVQNKLKTIEGELSKAINNTLKKKQKFILLVGLIGEFMP